MNTVAVSAKHACAITAQYDRKTETLLHLHAVRMTYKNPEGYQVWVFGQESCTTEIETLCVSDTSET